MKTRKTRKDNHLLHDPVTSIVYKRGPVRGTRTQHRTVVVDVGSSGHIVVQQRRKIDGHTKSVEVFFDHIEHDLEAHPAPESHHELGLVEVVKMHGHKVRCGMRRTVNEIEKKRERERRKREKVR